jgi:hypothetical protein
MTWKYLQPLDASWRMEIEVKSLNPARRLPTAGDRATTAGGGAGSPIGAAAAGAEAPFLFCISWSADQASWSASSSSPSPQLSSLPQFRSPSYPYLSRVTRARIRNLLEASGGLPPSCQPWRRTWPPRSATPSCTTVSRFPPSYPPQPAFPAAPHPSDLGFDPHPLNEQGRTCSSGTKRWRR